MDKAETKTCFSKHLPVPKWCMDHSLRYLMKFYNDITTCENQGVACSCFSAWLRQVFEKWCQEIGQPGERVNHESKLREYTLENMTSFLLLAEDWNMIEKFLKEADAYYELYLSLLFNLSSESFKTAVWIPDGKKDIHFRYSETEKLKQKCPYI